ncbi:MAG: hypothetical protein AVDCRST_MAG59-2529, partial [uncultured Thermomicrobiales bacterium]
WAHTNPRLRAARHGPVSNPYQSDWQHGAGMGFGLWGDRGWRHGDEIPRVRQRQPAPNLGTERRKAGAFEPSRGRHDC